MIALLIEFAARDAVLRQLFQCPDRELQGCLLFTRLGPVLRAGVGDSIPYTADQRERINEINKHVSLNTLSRIWQVMVASVPEMAAAANQKQCFDMLIIRIMHIADIPSVPEILKQNTVNVAPRPDTEKTQPEKPTINISSATDLADALSAAREMMLYAYFTKNIEVTSIVNNEISYFDRGDDSDFQQKLIIWLNTKTGATWKLNRTQESHQDKTVREQIKTDVESDPMVADAMSLFEGAEIVGISKKA